MDVFGQKVMTVFFFLVIQRFELRALLSTT
jgi:hypothetical protein